MDRRQFLANSLKTAAVAGLSLDPGHAATVNQRPQEVPGAGLWHGRVAAANRLNV